MQADNIFNGNYVSNGFDYSMFTANNTIVIESDTGTGKTTATAKHFSMYFKTNDLTVLSIVNKIYLAGQHIKSFDDANITLQSYQDKSTGFKHRNLVLCINSIQMISKLTDVELSNYVVYIIIIIIFITVVIRNTYDRDTQAPVLTTGTKFESKHPN